MKETSTDTKPPHRKHNGKQQLSALGPVANLEDHLRPDWWRHIFNSLYLKTDGDVVDDPDLTRQEIDLFSQIMGLREGDRILDLCCGQGRHTLELARRGFTQVEGLDRSRYLIQKARDSARKSGLNVRFKEGDARRLPYPPGAFEGAMLLGNSFGYFANVQDDLKVLTELHRVLKTGGKLLMDVTDGEYTRQNFEPRSWEWAGKHHFVCRERCLSSDGQRLISREVASHVEKGIIADQFYAERLYTRKSLGELLNAAGFSTPTYHTDIATSSQRNQDLGMMAMRLIVSSTAG